MATFGFCGLLLLAARPVHSAPADKTERVALTVTTVHPITQEWPETLLVSGAIHAWQEAIVASEIGGLAITSLGVDVGSEVKQGEELARLSDVTIQANRALQRANVARAKAAFAMAHANGDRAREVKSSGALSEQQITLYLTQEATGAAELAATQAALELEEVRWRQTRILAADDGVISSRSATLGAVVQVGSELFRLIRQNRLEWRAELTPDQLAKVKPDMPARLFVSNGQTIQASLRQIAPTLDPNTRKGLVYFDLPKDPALKAGLFAQGEILLSEQKALTLPESAIVYNDGFSYVFELTAPDRVSRHKVTTGRRQDNRIEIITGIAENTTVVATGGAFLKDGDRVMVIEKTP